MEYTVLGKTGFKVSRLGIGTAEIGLEHMQTAAVSELLLFALDHGINLIDTARGYEQSEELIGKTVAHRRRDFILVTKCGYGEVEGKEFLPPWSKEKIAASVDQSLKKLRTDHIDIMLLHTCSKEILEQGEALEALIVAKEKGKIRFIGYSGDNEEAIYALSLPEIDVLEMSLNVTDQKNLEKVLLEAKAKNVGVLAKRPLANCPWKDPTELSPSYAKEYGAEYRKRFEQMQLKPEDFGIEKKDWPKFFLSFVLSFPEVHSVIVGTTKLEHLFENIETLQEGPLEESILQKVKEAFRKAEQNSASPWLAQG
ncbi:aldo/keto reductase [Candidatus Methylacidiphilum fumarolicum]|uniref:Aldo/keto reductase family enzyme n=2 Tax=Candidatus Methylacidiphilum fumarolicum TaxID=591154 RepID=I0JYI8_METFB|nr:aldo/keto reductase [Candidatus Methylacidiphilum fumarolicum]MBW6415617.1 aldo/keto reductase [Candidatus Methylacidiphilum fumarolicum]TFE67918.1 aldo/keto reductase [Candidatus Methylacidiphilum fumarolicum]TFE71231.1 aldo/keto reductase [Candidatus Methylacidiphilum fumarolicum]TFE74533.1 aldo/keto reductase [Candidatus Methylacidiphilum fumarolicum]TFE74711.1 aldo/keto reductase [Candidatus Methylacidiphilum fumarolicum]